MEEQSNTPRSGIRSSWIYLSIIAILLAAGIYLFLSKNKAEDENEELTNQVSTVTNDKDNLQKEFEAALLRLDEMKNQSLQADSLLHERAEEVDALKKRIQKILASGHATESQLKEARNMINEFKNRLNNYEKQITALKQENIQLTEENKDLTEQKGKLEEDKSTLQETVKDREKTIELGSVLHASGFKMEAINQKKNLLGKEKEVETSKAHKADLIRITFNLDDNRISESGEKMLYICVTDPSGNVSANPGSRFKLNDGSDKPYTVSKTVAYKKGEPVYGISCEWKPSRAFEAGKYKVEVFHMGYKIGGENVSLK